jgi:hypothetical protein
MPIHESNEAIRCYKLYSSISLLTTIFISNNILRNLMEKDKRVIILVTIALILAATAIVLNIMEPEEVSTETPVLSDQPIGGEVGVSIEQNPVEDKATEEAPLQ